MSDEPIKYDNVTLHSRAFEREAPAIVAHVRELEAHVKTLETELEQALDLVATLNAGAVEAELARDSARKVAKLLAEMLCADSLDIDVRRDEVVRTALAYPEPLVPRTDEPADGAARLQRERDAALVELDDVRELVDQLQCRLDCARQERDEVIARATKAEGKIAAAEAHMRTEMCRAMESEKRVRELEDARAGAQVDRDVAKHVAHDLGAALLAHARDIHALLEHAPTRALLDYALKPDELPPEHGHPEQESAS